MISQKKYPENPVLMIDDEQRFLHIASLILRTEGITNIIKCSDSRNVISMLSQKKFSVILLDLTMPHISGFDLLPKIIKNYPDIPVIIISGEIDDQIGVKCLEIGAFNYIAKPIEKPELVASIKGALKYSGN